MDRIEMQHGDITERIIGCAYTVYNRMGSGFLESVYEKCLMIELRKAGLRADTQWSITVRYDDEVVGEFVADILVEDAVIVELKAAKSLSRVHEVQLVNYLTATDKDVGLLINFSEEKVEAKRKTRTLPPR